MLGEQYRKLPQALPVHLALGSIIERVLHTIRLPLLVVRPPDMLAQVSLPTMVDNLAETHWRTSRASGRCEPIVIQRTTYVSRM